MSNSMIVNRLRELDAEPSGISDVALAAASEIERLAARLAEETKRADANLGSCFYLQEKLERAEARLAEAEALLREARECVNVWTTTSNALYKGCPCSACENTRTQRRIDAFLSPDNENS